MTVTPAPTQASNYSVMWKSALLGLCVFMLYMYIRSAKANNKDVLEALILLLVCTLLITVVGKLVYNQEVEKRAKKCKDDPKSCQDISEECKKDPTKCKDLSILHVGEFLDYSPFPEFKPIMVGMVSGMVFGFIDNAGLFFGMDKLDKFLPGSSNSSVKAGFGNTFSDLIGAFLGTFAGLFIQNYSGIKDTPIWADAVGIVIGCIIGILIPYKVMGGKW